MTLSDFPDRLLLGPFGVEPPEGAEPLSPDAASARIDGWFASGRSDWLSLALVANLLERTHIEATGQRQGALRSELLTSLRAGRLRLFAQRLAPPVAPEPLQEPLPAPRQTPVVPSARAATTTFLVKWVDELGVPLSDLRVLFSISGGIHTRTADEDGVARFLDVGGSNFAFVEAVDTASVREAVRDRWDRVREGTVLTDEAALVQPLLRNLKSVPLEAEQMVVISVQPYVSRQRLVGGHFDTSKCFLLPQGLPGIRAIVQCYETDPTAKLLIVGHTDRAGAPDINDPLSLERAQALRDYLSDNVDGGFVGMLAKMPRSDGVQRRIN